jgi:hypothetical protein
MKISKNKAKEYIYKSNGKIFSAVFVKKDGEKRLMTCRRGVYKHSKGIGLKFNPDDRGLVNVFDMQKKAYRFININTLEGLKLGGKKYEIS